MKKILKLLSLIAIMGCWQFAQAEENEAAHDHDEAAQEEVAGQEAHAEEAAEEKAPRSGRILTKTTPHLEFLATEEGKAEIRALNEHNQEIELPELNIKLFGGSRANPTKLIFELKDKVLVSDGLLPKMPNASIVLQIKDKDGNLIVERFNLNLSGCPGCDNKEYACTCDHSREDHDHDHDHDGDRDHEGHNHD